MRGFYPKKNLLLVRKSLMNMLLLYSAPGYTKLMSEETLVSDGSSEGEGPGSKVETVGGASGDQRHEHQKSSNAGPSGSETE